MADKITLRSLFDSKKPELEQKLEGMVLPRDSKRIQETIEGYLAGLFDSDGDFRQNLTQSEDYLLQATMSLLTAQQEMANAFITREVKFKNVEEYSTTDSSPENDAKVSSPNKLEDYLSTSVGAKQSAIGAGAGAVLGRIALGGWGAVF